MAILGRAVVPAALWAVLSAPPAFAVAAERPNILWLVAEDLGPHLGSDGTREVETPRLDRLATEGARYTRFFTTAPVCSASRSAFMTGMYQTTIGAHDHRSHRDDGYSLPRGVRVLTDWMRDAGYYTANVVRFPEGVELRGTGKTDWNFTYRGRPFDSDRWEDLKAHEPFFAQVNFSETHRASVEKQGSPWPYPRRADPARVVLPPYYPDHPVARRDWAGYLDAVTSLDEKVGRVLDLLEKDGLASRTVVVFFGDNGQAHVRGKQFCYDSGLRVPMIVRLPRAVASEKDPAPGVVVDALVSAIDLAPAMLSIAGARRPEGMQGQVFLGAHAAPARRYVFGARDRCDETVFRIRTVRDARYRYIRNFTPDRPLLQSNRYKEESYPVWNLIKELHRDGRLTAVQARLAAPTMPDEELFDTEADPHEIENLASSPLPAHQEALRRLRGALEKWIEETDDKGRVPEPPEVAAARGATRPGSDPNASAVRP